MSGRTATKKAATSVRDRSTGECAVCTTEQKLDDKTGLVVNHFTRVKGKQVRCQGSEDYPTKVLHDPALAIQARAVIHEHTVKKASSIKTPKKSVTRKAPVGGKVTVTRVDPKVWADAVATAKRLGLPASSIEVVFRVRESLP